MRSEIPPLCLAHKELPFPEIPSELLALNTLEERFLAPRIGFIQIRTSNIDQQKKSKGRIVNVPTDPSNSIQMLPRTYENLGVIMVQLKKRNKHSEIVSSVRIDVIRRAALILAKSEAFRAANIQINLQELQSLISQARNKL